MHCLVWFSWKPNPIILIHEKGLVQCLRIPDRQPVWPGDLARKNNPNKLETILCFPFCLTPCPSISNPYQLHLSFIRSYFSIFTTIILHWTAIISLDLQQFFVDWSPYFFFWPSCSPSLAIPHRAAKVNSWYVNQIIHSAAQNHTDLTTTLRIKFRGLAVIHTIYLPPSLLVPFLFFSPTSSFLAILASYSWTFCLIKLVDFFHLFIGFL